MTLYRYADTLRDQFQRPIEGASVSVENMQTGAAQPLFDDDNLPIENPQITDMDGYYAFNVETTDKLLLTIRFGGRVVLTQEVGNTAFVEGLIAEAEAAIAGTVIAIEAADIAAQAALQAAANVQANEYDFEVLTAEETEFELPVTPGVRLFVYVDGVRLTPDDFTVAGAIVTLGFPAYLGQKVSIVVGEQAMQPTVLPENVPGLTADLATINLQIMDQGPMLAYRTGESPAEQTARVNAFANLVKSYGGGRTQAGVFDLTSTIDLRGYDIEVDCNIETTFDISDAVTRIKGAAIIAGGGDVMTQLPNFSANIAVDDQVITFATPPSLSPGDLFIIYNTVNDSWGGGRDYYRAGEWMRALEVSGTSVTIDAPAARSYTVGANMQVWKPTMKSVVWNGGEFASNPAYGAGIGLVLFQAYEPLIANLRGGSGNATALCALRRCYGGVIDSPVYWDNSPDADLNYAINFIACHRTTLRNANVRSRRHGVTLTGGGELLSIPNRFCAVEGGNISGGLWAVDMHASNDRCEVRDLNAFGGVQIGGRGPRVRNVFATGNMNAGSDPGACIRAGEILDANISIKDVTVDDEGTKRSMVLLNGMPSGGSLVVDGVEFVANSTTPDFVVNVGYASGWTGTTDINISNVTGQSATTCPIVEITVPNGNVRHIKVRDIDGASVRTTAVADLIDIRDASSADGIVAAVTVNLLGATQVVMDNITARPTTAYSGNVVVAVRGAAGYASDYSVDISNVSCAGLMNAPVVDVTMDVAATALAKYVRISRCVGVTPRFTGKAEYLEIRGNDARLGVSDGIAIAIRTHIARQDIVIADNFVLRANKCGLELDGPGAGTATYLTVTGNQSFNNNRDNSAASSSSKSSVRVTGFGSLSYHDNTVGDDQGVATQVNVDAIDNVGAVAEYQNRTIGALAAKVRTSIGYIAPSILSGTATYDPANLVSGTSVTTTVTVSGAALGDTAQASFTQALQGLIMTAWVSAANTVSVQFQNNTGADVNLASGTLRATITKGA